MKLCDVTVREGGQMPGRTYDVERRLEAGLALDRLGVDFVQPGFAAAGEHDAGAISELAGRCDADVVSIARAVESDVEAALEADADVVEVFGPLSRKQLRHTVGQNRDEMLSNMRTAVNRARDSGATVHLTLVDAFRTEVEHVVGAFERFESVDYLGLADTVGARTPQSVSTFLGDLCAAGVDLEQTGVHFHDDLGVATANALAAADLGVGKADVSVASLGERAGNAALEEVVAAGVLELDDPFGVEPAELVPSCRAVLDALGETVGPRKAVLGSEVTTHEAAIHVAAMLSDPSVMEPFDPGRFGASRRLLFGERTGRTGARRLLERADREPTDALVEELLARLAERGPLDENEAVEIAGRL